MSQLREDVQAIWEQRRAGILLHPTSLPGDGETGDLGAAAYYFVDFLHDCGITAWQMLPLGPTLESGSPYQCLSVHAGNTGLISLDALVEQGWLSSAQGARDKLLQTARQAFVKVANSHDSADYANFKYQQAFWLDDYALFKVLKVHFGNQPWWEWPEDFRDRKPAELPRIARQFAEELEQQRFEQYLFFRQWRELRAYANERGILLFGDMPIFVAHDSADVWINQHQFYLDEQGQPIVIAGVPPDYFSATGQRWGNPLYNWDRMSENGFLWWVERVRTQLELFDLIRIDHFRGFEAYWEIPANEETAINGRWVKAPGRELFNTLLEQCRQLPFVAEDLGIITPQVEALRDDYGFPGMKILQFAFGGDAKNPYLPHNHIRTSVAYTGTHDNNTSLGWYEECDEKTQEHLNDYLGYPSESMPWPLIRSALASTSALAVIPMQDLLELGSEARMNTPGTCCGNWDWRFQWSQVNPDLATRMRHLLEQYGRLV